MRSTDHLHAIISPLQDDLHNWSMSEKHDGINATWDRCHLISRDGNVFAAPSYFTDSLPSNTKIVGELWCGRGGFETACGIVKDLTDESRWQQMLFMAFSPNAAAHQFGQYARCVHQLPCPTADSIYRFYSRIVERGGEGVMLRHTDGDEIKLKPSDDDDAEVVEHVQGTGRNCSHMGSIVVRDRDSRIFRLGNGFSASDRAKPPQIGSIVRFRFEGRTRKGIPRNAVYCGTRAEASFV